MKNLELPCYLVEDLLPLYADHLVSSQTQNDIQTHLSGCKNCYLRYQAMTTPMGTQRQTAQESDAGGIRFLKKERQMGIYKVIAAVVCCLALFLGAFYWAVLRQQAFDFQVENLCQLADGSIYFELVPSAQESAISGISYHDGLSQDESRYEIQMGYSLFSLWQSQKSSLGRQIYCFVLAPAPNSDGTSHLPVYYIHGSRQLLIWDGKETLPAAPAEIEEASQTILSPFSIRRQIPQA